MTTLIALLRGINVIGNTILPMTLMPRCRAMTVLPLFLMVLCWIV